MHYKYRFLSILFIPLLLLSVVIAGCGDGDGSSDGQSTAPAQMIQVEGTIADVMANAGSSQKSFLLARIINFLNPTQNAIAQMEEMDDLSGIIVVASVGDTVFGPVETDENGNFEIMVPCDTPLSFNFSTPDDSINVDFGEISFSCPEGAESTTAFLTVTIDTNDSDGGEVVVEEQDDPESAPIFCTAQEERELIDEEGNGVVIDGGGGPCIISSGGCELFIQSPFVSLTGCSTCVDTRGNSSVEILSGEFECEASDIGVRSVGVSSALIDVLVDSTVMSTAQTLGLADLFISAGITGVDARGNSSIDLVADNDDSDMMDETMMGSAATIEILGGGSSVSAVGNSEVEVEAEECFLDPAETEARGNAEIDIDCDNLEDDE